MSIHPNAMLLAHLSPNDMPRKTYLQILSDAGLDHDDPEIKIGGHGYRVILMDGDYDEDFQITGAPGEIVLMDMVTYGYGERIAWDDLRARHNALAEWIETNTERYSLEPGARISVSANYW